LPFDPEKYRKYLAETGWSEKVQDEWLETLLNMMGTFVDLAWDTDPVQTVLKAERPSSSEKLQPMAQGTSNPHNVRKSLRKTGNVAGYSDSKLVDSGHRIGRNFRTPEISCVYRALRSSADRRAGSGVPKGRKFEPTIGNP